MKFDVITDDLQFPEGPVAMADGSVLLVEIRRQTLTRVLPDGAKSIVAELGGGPNGLAIGPDGAAYVANNGGATWHKRPDGLIVSTGPSIDYTGGSIQRVDLTTGAVTTLYTECDGRPLRGPNDLVFDAAGGFWFTDSGKKRAQGHIETGQVYYAQPDGSSISCLRDGMVVPNGIGLSPDERVLYVAETLTSRLWALDITRTGSLAPVADPFSARGPDRALGPLPGYQLLDSLAVEADGRICVGTLVNGGITIFDPHDGSFEHVAVADPMVTNICFGGADMRDAWLTAAGTGRLYRCRWPRSGHRLNFSS